MQSAVLVSLRLKPVDALALTKDDPKFIIPTSALEVDVEIQQIIVISECNAVQIDGLRLLL